MRTIRFRVVLVGLFSVVGSVAFAADNWQGTKIMPKSDQFHLQKSVEGGSSLTGDVYQIAWPATVMRTNGRWLWIEDEGGYSKPPVAGWVYIDDVLPVDSAGAHYTEQLRRGDEAWLYWLRGIFWEDQGKAAIAQGDFQEVVDLETSRLGTKAVQRGDSKLDDAWIRLGRLVAKSQYADGKGRYSKSDRNEWEQHFQAAEVLNPKRAQLYLDWGYALSQACSCGEKPAAPASQAIPANSPTPASTATPSKTEAPANTVSPAVVDTLAKEASDKYDIAATSSNHWWRVPYSQAELLLRRCDEDSPDGYKQMTSYATPKTLKQAEKLFNQAISWDPNVADSHRDLGETLRLQSGVLKHPPLLEEARQSATTACVLSSYREYASLRTLAQIYADLKDFASAEDYADRAAKAAIDESDAQQLARLWILYDKAAQDLAEIERTGRSNLSDNTAAEEKIVGATLATKIAAIEKAGHPYGPGKGPDGKVHRPLLPPDFILQSHSSFH